MEQLSLRHSCVGKVAGATVPKAPAMADILLNFRYWPNLGSTSQKVILALVSGLMLQQSRRWRGARPAPMRGRVAAVVAAWSADLRLPEPHYPRLRRKPALHPLQIPQSLSPPRREIAGACPALRRRRTTAADGARLAVARRKRLGENREDRPSPCCRAYFLKRLSNCLS